MKLLSLDAFVIEKDVGFCFDFYIFAGHLKIITMCIHHHYTRKK